MCFLILFNFCCHERNWNSDASIDIPRYSHREDVRVFPNAPDLSIPWSATLLAPDPAAMRGHGCSRVSGEWSGEAQTSGGGRLRNTDVRTGFQNLRVISICCCRALT